MIGPQARICDNTDCSKAIPDNSHWHPAFSKFSTIPSGGSGVDTAEVLDMGYENADETLDEASDDASIDETDDAISEDSLVPEDLNQLNASSSSNQVSAAYVADGRPAPPNYYEQQEQPTHQVPDYEACEQLPCNIFMTGETDLQFVDYGFPLTTMTLSPSHYSIVCKAPVHQALPPGLHMLRNIERLNMIDHIPELAVVALGNQAGRVALLTATYWPEEHRYGFKIEVILPYKSQEEKGMRPESPLLGMAISPVQGQGLRAYSPSHSMPETALRKGIDTSGRYRLLMMYYDQTILSYEISRPCADGEVLAF